MNGRTLSFVVFVVGLAASATAQQPTNTVFVSGLNTPVDMVFFRSDRAYVAELGGTVRIVQNGVLQSQPLLDISDEVSAYQDHGMTGIALDPGFAQNGRLYVTYAVDRHHLMNHGTPAYSPTTNQYYAASIARLTRYTCDPATDFTTILPGSRHVLVGATLQDAPVVTSPSHGACSLQFGRDGTLLVGFGDGAWFGQLDAGSSPGSWYQQALADGSLTAATNVGSFRAQQIDSLNGKILRIDPDTGAGVPSNPFFDPAHPASARSRVWSLGLRNPARMALRPGTGATDPALGRPGHLYVGDVGWTLHEELDVATVGGQNFGWPIFEGLEPNRQYLGTLVENRFAPNPLVGRGCGVPFFRFQDLLQQDNGANLYFGNPCDLNTAIPLATPTFRHRLPVLDWTHEIADARVAVFAGGQLNFPQVGSPTSGVSGAPFTGNCAIAGTWHSGLTFPASFGPCYYQADFAAGWIKRLTFDDCGRLVSVDPFANVTLPLRLVEGPDHWLYCIGLGQPIRRLGYGQNPLPVPVPFTDGSNRPGTYELQVDGRASFDPLGEGVTVRWQLDTGPSYDQGQLGFTIPRTGVPALHEVRLLARDVAGGERVAVVPIVVDNTPPRIERIDVDNGRRFDARTTTTLPLSAIVADDEHTAAEIDYEWRTTRHDGDDRVDGPIDTAPATAATLLPVADDGQFHAYSISLRVTDAATGTSTKRVWLFPHRTNASTSVVLTTPTGGDVVSPGEDVVFEAIPTGPVQRIEFRVEGELVGVATGAPWRAAWRPTRAGAMVACALAIATDRTTSCSRGTEFTVLAPTRSLRRITDGANDAYEELYSGTPWLDEGQLMLGDFREPLVSGLRFDDLAVPPGATVVSAHVDFTAAAIDSSPTTLLLACEASLAPAPIDPVPGTLTQRTTGLSLSWRVPAWNVLDAGPAQRTPELRNLLQPLVGDPSWSRTLMLLGYGLQGVRASFAADSDPMLAPLLCVDWLPPEPVPASFWAAASGDDANEHAASGAMNTTAPVLELGGDAGNEQLTGVRLVLPVAHGAIVESARLCFTAAVAEQGAAEWTIRAEANDDAVPFGTLPLDLSTRATTTASVVWTPPAWTPDVGGPAQRSPELRTLLQQVVDRPGWVAGNACVLVIAGSGKRTAHSRDAGPRLAPRLELIVR